MKTTERAMLIAGVLLIPCLLGACERGSGRAGSASAHAEDDGHVHAGSDGHAHAADDGHDHEADEPHTHTGEDDHSHGGDGGHAGDPASGGSDRVSIPESVRSNLGISFVAAERRWIEQTLRVPGRFEYLPDARREYRTAVPGRVEILIEQFERVSPGQLLYRIDSPAWRQMQQQLADAGAQIRRLTARLGTFGPLMEAHRRHEESLDESVAVWDERVEQLRSVRAAGGGRTEELAQTRAALASTRAELASVQEKKAELEADRQQTEADLDAARARLSYLLDSAAAVVLVDRAALERVTAGGQPAWALIDTIGVRATGAGVVESLGLTNGSWADERSAVLTVVRPDRLRFRASGLQSDLGVLRDGLPARIVPPTPTMVGRAVPLLETMRAELTLGLAGDPNDRTLELFVVPDELRPWARPGVTAQLEIVTDATAQPEISIPLAAVQRDGLAAVVFRRSRENPDEAVRVEARLGRNDGRWVAVLGGLRDGDEVVLDGAFQLMLATSGSVQKGGHFHADGSFHEGED